MKENKKKQKPHSCLILYLMCPSVGGVYVLSSCACMIQGVPASLLSGTLSPLDFHPLLRHL